MKNPSYHCKAPIVVTEKMRRQIAGADGGQKQNEKMDRGGAK